MKFKKTKKIITYLLLLAMACGIVLSFSACKSDSVEKSYVECVDDLANATIGVQLGTTGDIYVSDEFPDATIQQFNKGADAIQSLKQGKVDCVVIDKLPAEAFVNLNKDLSILDEEFTNEDYAIAIAKGNDELLADINAALAELKENGTMQKIIDNYIGDNKGSFKYETPEGTDKSKGTLVMATNAAFEPYEYVEGGKIVGIDADLALAISDILGMELEIEDMEFDSIITAVSSGKADIGMAGMTVTEDRLKSINFSDSYTTSTQVIVVRNGEKTDSTGKSFVESVDDLANATIGVQLGTTGDIYVSDEFPDATIQQFNKGADAIQSLKQGKVDCVVIDKLPAESFVNLNKDLSILDEEFTNEDYAIAIAKGNDELLADINAALAELKENGTMQKIIDNYIGDNKGSFKYETPEGTDKSKGTLVMATNAAFEPYEYVEGGKIVGIDADLALAISDILGMELVIEDMEFDSIITAVSSGKADIGMAGMTVTEDRLKSINFSDSYTTSTQVIVVRNGESDELSFFSLERFKNNFIKDSRWKYIAKGLVTTLEISFFAVIMGIALGFLFAIVRATSEKTGKLKFFNLLVKIYVTIIRGTPVVIQLLIIYYVIFASTNISKVLVAVLAFGLNSAAYMTEIVRAGIMSIDNGQFEAGRSMGFNYVQTMKHFILPQALKNVLPAMGNELIVLIKETSIAGYIGIMDMTRGGDYIRSRTYDAFPPLIAVALVYLGIVMILTALVGKLERRLQTDGK